VSGDDEHRRDELALASFDAAMAALGAAVGYAYGPVGGTLATLLGPFAHLAVRRLLDLRSHLSDAGFSEEEILERLEENERLAQHIAEVVRGTVESDLEAKRRLLARSAVKALGR
jgi:hypothetical protein